MTIIILSSFLCIFIGISIYFIYRAYYLAGIVSDQQDEYDQLESVNSMMYYNIEQTYNKFKEIDAKGSFESDDEVGTTFEMLLETINELYNLYGETEEKK